MTGLLGKWRAMGSAGTVTIDLNAVLGAMSLFSRLPSLGDVSERAKAIRYDPFGAHVDGAFFRDAGPTGPARLAPSLGDGRAPLALVARHLPTPAVRDAVIEELGEGARPGMDAWAEAWERAVGDVGKFALDCLYLGFVDVPPTGLSDVSILDVASRLNDGKASGADAETLFGIAEAARHARVRTHAAHALEDAAMTLALVRTQIPFALYVRAKCGAMAKVTMWGRKRGARRVGRRGVARLARDMSQSPEYWNAPAFRKACRRRMVEADGALHAVTVLLDMARQGHAKAFVKHAVSKRGTWVVDLAGVSAMPDAMAAFARALGPTALGAVPIDDRGDRRLIVQEFAPFAYEHRFFVVRGRVVASTSSDRGLTVLDGHGRRGRLDPRVARLRRPANDCGPYDRGDTESEVNPDLVAAMAGRVRNLVAQVAADPLSGAMLGDAYVVDVGSDGPDPRKANVELIEVNTFRNAGAYALDHDRIARALANIGSWEKSTWRPEKVAKTPKPQRLDVEALIDQVFADMKGDVKAKAWVDGKLKVMVAVPTAATAPVDPSD